MSKANIAIVMLIVLFLNTTSIVLSQDVEKAESRVIKLANIESNVAINLLPDTLKLKVKPMHEQNAVLAIGTLNEVEMVEDILEKIDEPLKQLELEVRVIELQKNALRDLEFFKSGGFLIGEITDGLNLFNFDADTWRVFNTQISYLERYGYAHIHAYPKLFSLPGRTASININTNNNLVLGSGISSFGQGINVGVVQTQRLDAILAGTNLFITPYLGKDDLITTMIVVEVSNNDGLTSQNGITLPTITTRREIDTNVQLMDGQTVAIGGLTFNNKTLARQGLPFLTQIPIIGDLTSNRSLRHNQSELLILITPRIKDLKDIKTVSLKDIQPNFIKDKYIIDENEDNASKNLPWYKKLFRRKN